MPEHIMGPVFQLGVTPATVEGTRKIFEAAMEHFHIKLCGRDAKEVAITGIIDGEAVKYGAKVLTPYVGKVEMIGTGGCSATLALQMDKSYKHVRT